MPHDRPAAEGVDSGHFPGPPVTKGHVAPNPRRIRARIGGDWVIDTEASFYVWEHPYYPQLAVPLDGLSASITDGVRSVPDDDRLEGYGVVTFDMADAWFEEDERVHGHPRSPYVRVDALRSQRQITVRLPDDDHGPGELLASAPDAIAVFETGLPPRWYLDPTTVDWSKLAPTDTETLCPYKGVARDWWSAGDLTDVAWSYSAPTPALVAIAGLVAFDDTQVTVEVSVTT